MNSDELARRLAELMKTKNSIEVGASSVSIDGVSIEDEPDAPIERTVRSRKTRKKQEFGKVKFLLSRFEPIRDTNQSRRVLYIAGDRPDPTRIFALAPDQVLTFARLHNLGTGDRWRLVLVIEPANAPPATQQTLVVLDSRKKLTVSPAPAYVGSEVHRGHSFFQYIDDNSPSFDSETETMEESEGSAVPSQYGFTANFYEFRATTTTYTIRAGSGWSGEGTGASTYEYSRTDTLVVPEYVPPPELNAVPTRYIFFWESDRIIMHDYANDFYTVVPQSVEDALRLGKTVEYYQTQPSVPIVRRYFKIRWDAEFEDTVIWNENSNPAVDPSYIADQYNQGADNIPFNSSTYSSTTISQSSINATRTLPMLLYRDQSLETQTQDWVRTESGQAQETNAVVIASSNITESFSTQIKVGTGDVKPYTINSTTVNNVTTTSGQKHSDFIFTPQEGIYTYQAIGSPAQLIYWKKDKDGNVEELTLPPVPSGVTPLSETGELVKGVLYSIKQLPEFRKGGMAEISQVSLSTMQESFRKHYVFPLPDLTKYSVNYISHHPN